MIYDPPNAGQITDMRFARYILSQDHGVRQNTVGHLRGNFYFTITDMTDSHGIKITDNLRNYYK